MPTRQGTVTKMMGELKIYRNLRADCETYFVHIRTSRCYVYGLEMFWEDKKGYVRLARYDVLSLKDQEHFPMVGTIDLDAVMTDAVLSAVAKGLKK